MNRRLRSNDLLAASIFAVLDHVGAYDTGVACDEVAATLGQGRGRVIAACDRLERDGYLVKDRAVVKLTEKARGALEQVEAA